MRDIQEYCIPRNICRYVVARHFWQRSTTYILCLNKCSLLPIILHHVGILCGGKFILTAKCFGINTVVKTRALWKTKIRLGTHLMLAWEASKKGNITYLTSVFIPLKVIIIVLCQAKVSSNMCEVLVKASIRLPNLGSLIRGFAVLMWHFLIISYSLSKQSSSYEIE